MTRTKFYTIADKGEGIVKAKDLLRTALGSLPRTNPGNRLLYKRQNGPYKLIMISGGNTKLPYGFERERSGPDV